ncbi:TrmH family RNA methyltransferase [Lihuaxuella thermophila]|uniref:RNA methyltransferase, TrmH family n=1 Tax=Lihuaxuella thermophila TaxID=1173111 RepID=A0A1H8CUQ1_9BACL|nr:RNA methyltransferase [Lihuaxuella thermophila]SEM98775.1 RNA methyltransferase, TrmH family [Lihuaxuella thermophila]
MNKIIHLTSPQNEHVKKWKKLKTKKGRSESKTLLIEGEHLIMEAISARLPFHAVIFDSGKKDAALSVLESYPVQAPVYELASPLFTSVTETDSPQGVAAVVGIPDWSAEELLSRGKSGATYLLLDAVQDPGNLGTIVRTAEAAGVTGIWLGKGTVDPFNPKVVRSGMGSLFRLPMVQLDLAEAISLLKKDGVTVVGTSPRGGVYHFEYPFPAKSAILLGNEGRGVDPALMALVDEMVQIPMPGKTESLNVSVTCAILIYERVRQRYPHL